MITNMTKFCQKLRVQKIDCQSLAERTINQKMINNWKKFKAVHAVKFEKEKFLYNNVFLIILALRILHEKKITLFLFRSAYILAALFSRLSWTFLFTWGIWICILWKEKSPIKNMNRQISEELLLNDRRGNLNQGL